MSRFDVFAVESTKDLHIIVAVRSEFSEAMTKALNLTLARYNQLRDQLNVWPNADTLVTFEYMKGGHGFVLTYNDNPSMTTRRKSETYKVVETQTKG